MVSVPAEKRCSKCGVVKPAADFYRIRDPRSRSGLASHCKDCGRAASRVAHHRDNSDEKRQRKRAYYSANSERFREQSQRWRDEHTEYRRDYMRRWMLANKNLVLQGAHRRLERLIAGGPIYSWSEWMALQAQYDYCCVACGGADVLLVPDHVIPLSKGGENHIGNIQPLCKACNYSKRNKVIDYRPT